MAGILLTVLSTLPYFWLTISLRHIAAGILLCIFLWHSYKVISDLCTQKRSSVRHLASIPARDRVYVWNSFWTHFSITASTISIILSAMSNWLAVINFTGCSLIVYSSSGFYTLSKLSMYGIFFQRLRIVYGTTAYEYNPRILISLRIMNVFYGITVLTLLIWSCRTELSVVSSYGALCKPTWPDLLIYTMGLYDFIVSIGFLIAFNRPLRKISQHMADNKECSAELVQLARKTKVLIWTAIISTLVTIAFIGITDSPIFAAIDSVVNSVCICLMCSYYQDERYYSKLCCLCIRCGHRTLFCQPREQHVAQITKNLELSSHSPTSASV